MTTPTIDFTDIRQLRDYIRDEFNQCGCSEVAATAAEIIRLLTWCAADMNDRAYYTSLYENIGTYYIMVGMVDNLGLCEHGTSIRFPWITPRGAELLAALKATSEEDIDKTNAEEDEEK